MTITLIVVIVLIIFSAFFSGSETGITAISRAKIHNLIMDGNKRAIMVRELRKDKDNLISTILLGNNAVNIAASALATSVAISYFGESGVAYVTVILTLVVLVFAEVLPKTYAFRNSEQVALTVAPVLKLLVKVLYPITKVVQAIVYVFLKLFGMKAEDSSKYGIDVLRGTIELHHHQGDVLRQDKNMLGSILDLADMEVEEVMVHRKEMETINMGMPVKKIMEQAFTSPHTRIPVWKDNPDNIVGILYIKDLVRALKDGKDVNKIDIHSVMKEPWFIPASITLKGQLQAFRKKRTHFALVVDEYGELLGLITLEDILEEIVGQINDEYDESIKRIRKQKDGSYIIDGKVSLRDINRELNWDLPDDEASTVAGLIIHDAELIPEVGQVFQFHGYRFEIRGKKRNQITKVKVSKKSKKIKS